MLQLKNNKIIKNKKYNYSKHNINLLYNRNEFLANVFACKR